LQVEAEDDAAPRKMSKFSDAPAAGETPVINPGPSTFCVANTTSQIIPSIPQVAAPSADATGAPPAGGAGLTPEALAAIARQAEAAMGGMGGMGAQQPPSSGFSQTPTPGGMPMGMPSGGYDPFAALGGGMPGAGMGMPGMAGADIIMDIDKALVGKIIGRGGATIQGLTDRTGAKLQMDQNVPEGAPRKLTISGNPQGVQMAKQVMHLI